MKELIRVCSIVLSLALAPWGLAPTAAADVTLVHKGLPLNGKAVLAEGKGWKDGAVLLVHGTLAHGGMSTIATLQTLLKDKGRSSVAINLSYNIGNRRGNYDCALPHTHRHQDAVDEIAAWVAWLKGQGADIVVLGHSRGGNHVARYATERIDPAVRSVVLLAPATWNSVAVAKAYEQRYKRSLARVIAAAQDLVKAGKGDALMPGIGFLTCPDTSVSAAAFMSYYVDDKKMDTPALLGAVPVPVLVIAGSADTLIPDIPDKMKGRVLGTVKFKMIDGADHFFRDLFAEDVVDAIMEFLGG
jgi:pimeloyl-ACP methyl ester carboxylesterase